MNPNKWIVVLIASHMIMTACVATNINEKLDYQNRQMNMCLRYVMDNIPDDLSAMEGRIEDKNYKRIYGLMSVELANRTRLIEIQKHLGIQDTKE